jgi:tetratricopeptide (TPR) repeat protein
MFDPPFSPREKGFTLTLYYLIALSTGYYAGYFLLVFGKKHPRTGEFQPIFSKLFDLVVVAGVWLLSIGAVAGLVYKNRPLVRMTNDDTFRQYTSLIVEKLPPAGAIVLSDDPSRLYLAQAALAREGREKDYLLLDSKSLFYPQYHRYLHGKWPHRWPLLVSDKQTDILNPADIAAMLAMLSKSNELCYLHPSSGFYFETFYQEQHGLIYQLKSLPPDTLLPPPPDQKLIAENEAFWADARAQGLIKSVAEAVAPPAADAPKTTARFALGLLRVPREGNFNGALIGTYCSPSLDFFGVELQRAGQLTNAAEFFETALELNPDNVVAEINLHFNEDLRAGRRHFVDLSLMSSDSLGKFTSIDQAITEGGPFDEPSFCYWCGYLAQEDGLYRQALAQFERVHEFDPGYLPARIWLARIYGLNNLPDRTLEALRGPMEHPEDYSLDSSDSIEVSMMAAEAYFQKNDVGRGQELLDREISRNPTNETLFVREEQLYLGQSLYTNALALANFKLRQSPSDPKWLFTKAYLDNHLKRYNDAIVLLNGILAVETNKINALTQRAEAYMGSGQFDAARSDYLALQKENTNSFQIAYNLGEIALRQHNTNEAVRNFEIYLLNSPTNAPEERQVKEQLRQLRPTSGAQ